jgi:hypothetical protein
MSLNLQIEIKKKILGGLKLSSKKMIETNIKNNHSILDVQNGKTVILTAED